MLTVTDWELIFDAATTSTAAIGTLQFAACLAVPAILWAAWLLRRGESLHGGVKMLGGMALLLAAIAGLYRYEQRYIASREGAKTVEGVVAGSWEERQRTSSSKSNEYRLWQGFYVNGVSFVYAPSVQQNYFHRDGVLRDGMRVRLTYFEEDKVNAIARVERARQ